MTSKATSISRAVELLNADHASGTDLYLYHDDATRTHWISTAKDLADLGRRLAADDSGDVYSRWCSDTVAQEVDLEVIVSDWCIDEDDDLDAVQRKAHSAGDVPAYMALRFLRDDIADIFAEAE